MITPVETIHRLKRLKLTDEEFKKIHHRQGTKGRHETIDSHIEYLSKRSKYIKGKNNYILALRLEYIENIANQGFDKKNAINNCTERYEFNKTT